VLFFFVTIILLLYRLPGLARNYVVQFIKVRIVGEKC